MMTARYRYALAAFMAFCMAAPAASQQNFPEKPVRIIVPITAGGFGDTMTRQIATQLSARWKQPVVVENRPGANTITAAAYVSKLPADGYTMLLATDATMSINPHIYAKLQYDPARDFLPVTQLVAIPIVLVANTSIPARNLAELVTLLKGKPADFSYASYGSGSTPHLAMEAFKAQARVELLHVPYKGSPEAITAAIAGQVQFTYASVLTAIRFIKDERLKALAVGGDGRAALLPAVPTFAEQGFPDTNASAWFGLVVPAGTPGDTITKIHGDVTRIITETAFRENVSANGAGVVASSQEAFAAFLVRDRESAGRAVKLAKLTAE